MSRVEESRQRLLIEPLLNILATLVVRKLIHDDRENDSNTHKVSTDEAVASTNNLDSFHLRAEGLKTPIYTQEMCSFLYASVFA